MAPEDEFNHVNLAKIAATLDKDGVLVNTGAHGQREGLGLHWELWMLVQGGLTPHEALRCATANGAKSLGMDRDIGTLEAGKLADVIVIDGQPAPGHPPVGEGDLDDGQRPPLRRGDHERDGVAGEEAGEVLVGVNDANRARRVLGIRSGFDSKRRVASRYRGGQMKARTILATLAGLFVGIAVAFAADPNMGTWKLNEAKSKFSPGATKNHTVVYAPAPGGMVKVTVDGVDKDGKAEHNEWTGKFDGKDYKVTGSAAYDTRAYTKVDANTLNMIIKKDGKVVATGKIDVSADGKSRTVTRSGPTRRWPG